MTADELVETYRRMARIRRFEEQASALYRDGEIPGFVHLSIGQEATAVGACWPLTSSDVITSTHRGHGHCLAKGLEPAPMFAELMARETGTCHGRGGSMHIADPGLGIFGANGIVAAGLPIANGAAFAAARRGSSSVVVAFFGDGAVNQGFFYEATNLAALWKLPVIFFCENNGYAEFAGFDEQHPVPLSDRAVGCGLRYLAVDGNDVEQVATAMTGLVQDLRQGGTPWLVEATTYRWHGHYEGDPERYRTREEVAEQQELRDPLVICRNRLQAVGVDMGRLDEVDAAVAAEMQLAVEEARHGEPPDPARLYQYVTVPRPPVVGNTVVEDPLPEDGAPPFRMMDALRLALEHELELDDSVFIAGIDVGKGGNVFGITRGLHDQFPGRVWDTPISESAIIGLGVGAAMAGMRPVVEIMYLDFIGVCLDGLMNQAAKLPFMTGGRATVPLVLRTQFGAGRSSGSQHSQSLEALLAHIPGLTVVMPSTPADAYGLLRSAIRDPNPVVFIENRLLYGFKGPQPSRDHRVPIGRARIVREGGDVTVVTASRMVHEAVAAADDLIAEGIDVEVIDLRTIAPLDRDTITHSVAKTSRLVVAHEAVTSFGFGAEVAALAASEAFWCLDAPIARVGARHTPPPYAPSLERAWLPDRQAITEAVRATVSV
jgi:2-oxoisovalerate dehydrogenase E1 component